MTLDSSNSYPENLIILQILVQTEKNFTKLTPMDFTGSTQPIHDTWIIELGSRSFWDIKRHYGKCNLSIRILGM